MSTEILDKKILGINKLQRCEVSILSTKRKKMHNLEKLVIWKKAIDLVADIYKLTSSFPESEKFGLISQINRSAVSVPSNIAEGAGRKSSKEFIHFLSIANGSIYELKTQLIISIKLNFTTEKEVNDTFNKVAEIEKMNFALQKRLKEKTE